MGMTWSNREDIPPAKRDGWIVTICILLAALSAFF